MPLRLVPLREQDVPHAIQFLTEAQEWSPRTDFFTPPLVILGKPDSVWLSAVNNEDFIGVVGFHAISWIDGVAEMFTSIAPKWRGTGMFATLAKLQLDFGFLDLGLRKITCQCLAGSPTAKLADKLQIPLEGTFKHTRLKRGVYYDSLAYGLERV